MIMTEQIIYTEDLAAQIAAAVERALAIPAERKLWSQEQVGHYLGLKKSQLYKVLATPGFPDARRPAGGHPRWLAGEVMKWAERQK